MSRSARFLAERSFLYFKYNTKDELLSNEFYLPMLENPDITETQKPNLATYDILGRPGSFYAYLGSKSREFTIKFKITIPHVYNYMQIVGLNSVFTNGFRYFKSYRDEKKNLMRGPAVKKSSKDKINHFNLANYEFNFHANVNAPKNSTANVSNPFNIEPTNDQSLALYQTLNKPKTLRYSEVGTPPVQVPKQYKDAINLVVLWINVIRTCVVGSAEDTSLGPPIVYVNHGSLYGNVPCVCTNYSIRFIDIAGYDLISLTPRSIEITLNLSENRSGNFEGFEPFKYVEGESTAGWESVMKYGTIDPHNNPFSPIGLMSYVKQLTDSAIAVDKPTPIINSQQDNDKSFNLSSDLLRSGKVVFGNDDVPNSNNNKVSKPKDDPIQGNKTSVVKYTPNEDAAPLPANNRPPSRRSAELELVNPTATVVTYKFDNTSIEQTNGKVTSKNDTTTEGKKQNRRFNLEEGLDVRASDRIRLTEDQKILAENLPYDRLKAAIKEADERIPNTEDIVAASRRNDGSARQLSLLRANPEPIVTQAIEKQIKQYNEDLKNNVPIPTVKEEYDKEMKEYGDLVKLKNDQQGIFTPVQSPEPGIRRSNE